MEIVIQKVRAGDKIMEPLGQHGFVSCSAPEDGITVKFGYGPSIYFSWSFLKDFEGSEETLILRDIDSIV